MVESRVIIGVKCYYFQESILSNTCTVFRGPTGRSIRVIEGKKFKLIELYRLRLFVYFQGFHILEGRLKLKIRD